MILNTTSRRSWVINSTLLMIAGGLIPLAFAPYSIWPFALISPAVLAILIQKQSPTQTLLSSLLFGIGLFGHGVSWVYVSIHDFGFTGAPLAAVMTALFVTFLALVFSLPFYIYSKLKCHKAITDILLFAAIWTLGEWLRSWLFTGFPWLYIGYAHIDTALAQWAPIGGVFLLSFLSIVSALCICKSAQYALTHYRKKTTESSDISNETNNTRTALIIGSAVVAIWFAPLILNNIKWTKQIAEPQTLSMIQPNVELIRKWDPYFFPGILAELDAAADQHWQSDIQVWPEAAIPSLYHDIYNYIEDVNARAKENQTNVFSGVLYDNEAPYEVYNSIHGMGAASGIYFKQKLVPFGEYVPFEDFLRGLIAFFDLPNSVIRRGPYNPDALLATTRAGEPYIVAPFICYEVVYPDFVAANARNAALLVTISNDAWFGNSIGPFQHFEMVRMRALENQKYYARATNTGISAIIDENGNVTEQSTQFTREVITGQVELRSGLTPFARLGSYPIILLCFAVLALALTRQRKPS